MISIIKLKIEKLRIDKRNIVDNLIVIPLKCFYSLVQVVALLSEGKTTAHFCWLQAWTFPVHLLSKTFYKINVSSWFWSQGRKNLKWARHIKFDFKTPKYRLYPGVEIIYQLLLWLIKSDVNIFIAQNYWGYIQLNQNRISNAELNIEFLLRLT